MRNPLTTALRLDGQSTTTATATITPDWGQGRATFGGLLAALAIRALGRVSAGQPLRSFAINFVAPVATGELGIQLELLRSGKSLIHAQARLHQQDVTCAVMLAAYGGGRATQLPAPATRASDVPAPASLPRLPFMPEMMPACLQHFDFRWASPTPPFSKAERGSIAGWVRPDDADTVDSAILAALIDVFPPAFSPQLAAPSPSSTVTWQVNFCGEPANGSAQDFWLLEGDTLAAEGGYASTSARIWDERGALRAISHQLVAEFSGGR
ncbi:MAG TPA: thioesterase family protein [Polyangiales bacterium]|nr:thioesterase family protein [Polyangiales bacterium]